MVSFAIPTQGTLFQIGEGTTPEVYHTIAEVRGFRGLGGGDAPIIDVTHFGSTRREKRLGMGDEGTLSFDLNFIPSDEWQQELEVLRTTGNTRSFKIVLTDGTTVTLDGLVKKFEKSADLDDVWRGSVDLEVSGEPDWVYAAP